MGVSLPFLDIRISVLPRAFLFTPLPDIFQAIIITLVDCETETRESNQRR